MNNIMNNIKIIYKNKNQKQEILRDRSALVNSVTVLSLTEGLIGVSQMRI